MRDDSLRYSLDCLVLGLIEPQGCEVKQAAEMGVMKKSALTALIVGLLVLGAVLLRSGGEPDQHLVSNGAESEGSAELTVPPAAAPRSTAANSELRPRSESGNVQEETSLADERDAELSENPVHPSLKEAFSATKASEYTQAFEQYAESDPDYAAHSIKDLSHFCNPSVIDYQAGLASTPAAQALSESQEAFCEDFNPSDAEHLLSRLSAPTDETDIVDSLARNPVLADHMSMEARLEAAEEDQRSDVFTELVRSAASPDQLFNLIAANQQHARQNAGVPLWARGSDLRAFYVEADLEAAQRTALLLFSCQRFGGCGHNQFNRIVLCQMGAFRTCAPGTSFQQHLYQITPPADLALAEAILLGL
ncbi:MAG: hypothetical protein V2J20_07655 [Wenzhouxiangella sp.]|nr:hypothetical protein [Wenzhouxiangella sp.]